MALLGKLGIVKARIGRLEIGAAILFVGIEEERIEPAVEIVMARDIVPGAAARIELLGMPDQVSQPPLQLGPARQDFGLADQDRQRVRDRTLLDDECPVHIDFAQREFRIEQDPPFGVGGEEPDGYRFAGAIATGKSGPARGRESHRPAANELLQKITQQTVHRNHRKSDPVAQVPAAEPDAYMTNGSTRLDQIIFMLLPGASALCTKRIFQNVTFARLRHMCASIRGIIG